MEVGDSEKRRGWMRPALRQKKGQRVFFRPLLPTALLFFLPLTTKICRFIKSDVYRLDIYLRLCCEVPK
ncbi:hypothetical protein HMPREF0083_04561 [Aneurinibacillus aneurinilyticus ATCC 12856]|uniref:Uncharacterized protein n=1 Tax=Aneurinibacillus aneurinilyticus ATCC 12856 TaxID=649747 RepID=U1WFR0_ANEAE|nr:hypothetical protein HMPREF0083_04561 [Aneurinibacillus aneurinilyticus ATCC 12856]